MPNPDWLARAARRSQDESWLLGHVFERYRQLEGCSQEELARELGCTQEVLPWLSLCRRPEGLEFEEQASTIARRFELELMPLVQVLRRVEVMDVMSTGDEQTETASSRVLLAARDRIGDEELDA